MSFAANSPISGHVNFNRYMPVALPGMLSGMGAALVVPALNSVGALDTVTLTPPVTIDNAAVYKVNVNGAEISFLTDANPTAQELGAGLYSAARLEPVFYSLVDVALDSGTGVLTLTSRSVGTTLTVTADGTGLTNSIIVNKTVNTARNAIIPFGRFVGRKADYYLDQRENVGASTLIDHLTAYSVTGVTLSSQATQKVGLYDEAQDGYAFGRTMNVVRNTGTYRGVWVETVESNLVVGDTARISVANGHQGKLTKNATGTVNANSFAKIVSGTESVFGRYITLVELKL